MRYLVIAALGTMVAVAASIPAAARAETQTEIVNDVRTILTFKVSEGTAQGLLPSGWQPNPATQGPSAGANLLLFLIDLQLATDATGKPLDPAVNQFAVLVVPGKETATGNAGAVVVGGFSNDPQYVPGPYRVVKPASVAVERTRTGKSAAETWRIEAPDGDRLALALIYERGTPSLVKFESKLYSGADPALYRIYRGDQGVDLVRSTATGMDRASGLGSRHTVLCWASLSKAAPSWSASVR